MDKTKKIIRYRNRKLYDLETSKYINLDQILQTVREGRNIEVVDYDTNRDVTGQILGTAYLAEQKYNAQLTETIYMLVRGSSW
jgi:polyhydroxyalkanoate synthesis regulator protein